MGVTMNEEINIVSKKIRDLVKTYPNITIYIYNSCITHPKVRLELYSHHCGNIGYINISDLDTARRVTNKFVEIYGDNFKWIQYVY